MFAASGRCPQIGFPIARPTGNGRVRIAQILDLCREDSWRINAYEGELEVPTSCAHHSNPKRSGRAEEIERDPCHSAAWLATLCDLILRAQFPAFYVFPVTSQSRMSGNVQALSTVEADPRSSVRKGLGSDHG